MNIVESRSDVDAYLQGWKRRRLARTVLMTTSLVFVALVRNAADNIYGQAAVCILIGAGSYDWFVSARREMHASSGPPSELAVLKRRELTCLRWTEVTEYLAAFVLAIGLIRHPLRSDEQAVIIALVAAGLFVRFGLRRWAKRSAGPT